MSLDALGWWLAAGIVVCAALWASSHFFSREARLGRRRRRNHYRIEPRGHQPLVKLSVRTRSKSKR